VSNSSSMTLCSTIVLWLIHNDITLIYLGDPKLDLPR
jgi:hypothetical protein